MSDDRQTHRQTDASNLIICPMLCYYSKLVICVNSVCAIRTYVGVNIHVHDKLSCSVTW